MALTRAFKDTVRARVQNDPAFRDALLTEGVKALLDGWEARSPGRRKVMFRALMNTRPSHLLDPALFDFAGLSRREAAPDLASEPPS